MYKVAAEKINEGLSLPARIILFVFSVFFGLIMLLAGEDNEKAVYFYAFGIFCISIGIACITKGRIRQFVGSLIALVIFIAAIMYLYSQVTDGPLFSGSMAEPSIINAMLFSFAFGLPAIRYMVKAKFGIVKNP
jgi:hypothetical protein